MVRSVSRTATLLAALVVTLCGAVAGCLLELPAVCGDGHLDLEAGEECDPAIVGEGLPPCDASCKQMTPASCGDGKLDLGEQCDGNDFGNKDCPSGKGFLSCTADCMLDESTCDHCGNGRIDLDVGEECDPKAPTFLLQPKNCSELTGPYKPYTSGQVYQCIPDECVWYRGKCGYCGDSEVDPPRIVDLNFPEQLSVHEVCDGPAFQPNALVDYCRARCPGEEPLCAFDCADSCEQFAAPPDDPKCCAQAGSPCPNKGDPLPCCAAYKAGLADLYSQEACTDKIIGGGLISRVCK
jgi:hypothetical protein